MDAEAGRLAVPVGQGDVEGCTNTAPTSRRTHSSNTPIRNAPQPSGVTDRSVTSSPWGTPSTHGRSTMGMNWMNSQPQSSRRKR